MESILHFWLRDYISLKLRKKSSRMLTLVIIHTQMNASELKSFIFNTPSFPESHPKTRLDIYILL